MHDILFSCGVTFDSWKEMIFVYLSIRFKRDLICGSRDFPDRSAARIYVKPRKYCSDNRILLFLWEATKPILVRYICR